MNACTAPARQPWPRAILLVDMNAFFAAVEQRERPELRGRPLGITNGQTGTCIITCSYEARAFGIRTGMRLREALRLCPEFLQIPARPHLYAQISTRIMETLANAISPDIEVFSVDEAFLDVTRCQRLLGTPAEIGARAQAVIRAATGLPCSVGVAGDKSTAKYAAKLHKPNGVTVIPPWETAARLRDVPVTELCGIADGIGRYLAERGVHRCGDMARLPVSELARRFGSIGRRIWLMAQGQDPTPVETRIAPPKSIGHGKVMPPGTRAASVILTYLEHMSFKVGSRLRRHDMHAQSYFIGLRSYGGWIGGTYSSAQPTCDGKLVSQLCQRMLAEHWRDEPVNQVQVTALDPQARTQAQLDLFDSANSTTAETSQNSAPGAVAGAARTNPIMDLINQRYGEYSLAPARLLNRSDMPNVIAPAWKPYGHRQSI